MSEAMIQYPSARARGAAEGGLSAQAAGAGNVSAAAAVAAGGLAAGFVDTRAVQALEAALAAERPMTAVPGAPAGLAHARWAAVGRVLGRILPGATGLSIAWLLYEAAERMARDAPRGRVAVNAQPPDVPSGWYVYEARSEFPTAGWHRDLTGYRNIGITPPGDWTDAAYGTPLSGSPPPGVEIGQWSDIETDTPGSQVQRHWRKLRQGGSTVVLPSAPAYREYPAPAHPLHPDVLPSIMPHVTPFHQWPGEPGPMPIPRRHVRRINEIAPQEDLIPREWGDPDWQVAYPPEWSYDPPQEWPLRPPVVVEDMPTSVAPDIVIYDPEAGVPEACAQLVSDGVCLTPPTHDFSRPRRAAEVKTLVKYFGVTKLLGAFTEAHDAVSAIHKALPKRCKRARTWRDKGGTWHRAKISSMLRDIRRCSRDINLFAAIQNLLANQVEDAMIGKASRAMTKINQYLGRGGQSVGTTFGRVTRSAGIDSYPTIIEKVDAEGPYKHGPTVGDLAYALGLSGMLPAGQSWPQARSRIRAYKMGRAP